MSAETEALRSEHEQMRSQLEMLQRHLPGMIWLRDTRTHEYGFLNDEYETLTGRAAGNLLADPADWMKAIHPDDRSHAEQVFGRWTSDAESSEEMDVRIVVDGKTKWISTRVIQVRDDNGHVTHLAGITQDITARLAKHDLAITEAQASAEQRHAKLKDEFTRTFLNNAAHDLVTPLTPMRVQLASLRVLLPDDPQIAAAINLLDRSVTRLSTLVREVLEVSRLDGGHVEMDIRPTPLSLAIMEAADMLHTSTHVIATGRETQASVLADSHRLNQILLIFLTNAVQFSPFGSTITVDVEMLGDRAAVHITDAGRGLDSADITKLFQPFAQLGNPETVGNGLGLHIAKGMLERQGGTAWATSDGRGKGSTFSFSLPLAPAERSAALDAQ